MSHRHDAVDLYRIGDGPQPSARPLSALFDLRQESGGCVSDSHELFCNRRLLTEEFDRPSLGRSQPRAQLLGRTQEFFSISDTGAACGACWFPASCRSEPANPLVLLVAFGSSSFIAMHSPSA